MLCRAFLCACIMIGIRANARAIDDESRGQSYGSHYGYTFQVSEEKNKRDIELVMLDEPPPAPGGVATKLVNEKLSREFQDQYKYRFGATYAEQIINSPGRSEDYMVFTGQNVTLQDYQLYQRQFAEYMGRRLTEYHVDNWVKNDPQLRPVYELKDKVSNLNVEVKKGYKFNWRYNFAGPSMDANLSNPYDVDLRMRMEMTGIISSASEMIFQLGYSLTNRVRAEALYKQVDGVYQLVLSRRMTRHIGMSLTGSMDNRPEGNVKQNLFLVGFSWSE